MTAKFIVGDTRAMLASLPDSSVDLVLCSPPFLALRSYLPADHEHKSLEIGSEATPGEFLDVLLDIVEECARVLGPYGTLAFELGDTYSGTVLRGNGPDARYEGRDGDIRPAYGNRPSPKGWPEDKSLCLIPQSFAWALSYGRNPFTGRETERWRVRNIVRWCRPNPPVGALGDKFRPATSEITVACKARDRWFDMDAVRVPLQPGSEKPRSYAEGSKTDQDNGQARVNNNDGQMSNPAGAPLLDWWEIPTQPYSGSHYATFPEKLVKPLIESMCPREVCRVCGEPRRRITETTNALGYAVQRRSHNRSPDGAGDGRVGVEDINIAAPDYSERVTLGWSDCGHGDYRRGVVLDPFCGSGTTLAVAEGLGRDSIGIDIDARNVELAYERCGGLFLTVEDSREGAA